MRLFSPRALTLLACLLAPLAFAQKVVILEIADDKGNKLRDQVQSAVEDAGEVTLLSIEKWRSAASKRKVSKPMVGPGVAKLAKKLGVVAAVGGKVEHGEYAVKIWAWDGSELWSKELKVKKGLLSDSYARKLAKAIATAAKSAPAAAEEADDEGDDRPVASTPSRTDKLDDGKTQGNMGEGLDLSGNTPPSSLSQDEREKRRREEQSEANNATRADGREPGDRDSDLEAEGRRKKIKVGPKVITAWLAGTTTWRSYCSRPGVTSCGAYANKDPKPIGDTVDFSPQVPYAGFNIAVEAFPLVLATDNPFLQGLGVTGNFGLGFSLTNVKVMSPSGDTPSTQVVSNDRNWTAQLAYRYYFSFAPGGEPVVGFIGLHGGVQSRVFEIDAKSNVPLPGSYRVYGALGLDGQLPILRFLKIDAGFSYFINPKPGPDEILGYGNPAAPNGGATGSGFLIEAGVSGDIWGPFGYMIKFRYTRFADQFFGQGKKWTTCDMTQCGGAAEEQYTGLIWGVTAAF